LSFESLITRNLRILDNAKDTWAIEHRKRKGDLPTASDVAPYCVGYKMPSSVTGETYNINSIGTPASAKITVSTRNFPAGSVFTTP
jgi:hypothetical protein